MDPIAVAILNTFRMARNNGERQINTVPAVINSFERKGQFVSGNSTFHGVVEPSGFRSGFPASARSGHDFRASA
jgi:hypothetical protein